MVEADEESADHEADEINRGQLDLITMVKKRRAQEARKTHLLEDTPTRNMRPQLGASETSLIGQQRSENSGPSSKQGATDCNETKSASRPEGESQEGFRKFHASFDKSNAGLAVFEQQEHSRIMEMVSPSQLHQMKQRLHTSQAAGPRRRVQNPAIFKSDARVGLDHMRRIQGIVTGGSDVGPSQGAAT